MANRSPREFVSGPMTALCGQEQSVRTKLHGGWLWNADFVRHLAEAATCGVAEENGRLNDNPRMSVAIPIRYTNPVFRPPSEADSLIIPLTDGCSWNRCTYCEMYTSPHKKFRARDMQEPLDAIRRCGESLGSSVQRVFLADGDALVLPTHRLIGVLAGIREHMPAVRRISSYCSPRNLRKKSPGEVKELADAGLSLVYVGAESGDDQVLERVNKGETFASTVDALNKLRQAGVKRSVMILNGLGGRSLSPQHAENSARLANETQPDYLATLVVSFPQGDQRFRAGFAEWQPLEREGLFIEMERFISALQLSRTVFRSDHASNWLALKGVLGADKARLLSELRRAIVAPESVKLRPAWARGL